MLDLNKLKDHLLGALPAQYNVDLAWFMQPIENDEINEKVPLITFYQASETFTAHTGSPHGQKAISEIHVLIVCKTEELTAHVERVRNALYNYHLSSDKSHKALYISDQSSSPSKPLDIQGDYIWWLDCWFTEYQVGNK